MNNRLYGNLIFELSHEGRRGYSLPHNKFGNYEVPADIRRSHDAELPECNELRLCAIIPTIAKTTSEWTTGSIRSAAAQ